MNTVGQILKEARLKKKISVANLAKTTKIKKEFIILIENNAWDKLPEFPVVSGFVKNLSVSLNIPVNSTNAVLRRDYPPKKLFINPKPDVDSKFRWSPKLTFVVGITAIFLVVVMYLSFEYMKFVRPPELSILMPKENEIVLQSKVKISGKTTTDSVVTVNNQPVLLDQDGNFETEIDILKETKELIFKAVSRSGKVTEIIRKIKVE